MCTMLAALAVAFMFLSAQAGAAEEKASEFIGTVEKAMSNNPRLVVGETHYRFKPAATAPDSLKETLKRIGDGKLTGKYKVTGKTEKEGERIWILVETIEKVKDGEKKEGAGSAVTPPGA